MISRVLVVGSGSIAKRHIFNLKKILPEAVVGCVSASGRVLDKNEFENILALDNIKDAVEFKPDLVVIASPAPFHLQHAECFLSLDIPVYMEKPLTNRVDDFERFRDFLDGKRHLIEIGYNLRHLSSAKYMKRLVDDKFMGAIYCISVDVGQYLPDWRPGKDFRKNVSSNKHLGGGALLELSHELDYLLWLFGSFDCLGASVRNTGALAIDVDEQVDILLSNINSTAHVHMDFLQRKLNRTCKVIGSNGNLIWDLVKNSVFFEDSNGVSCIFDDSLSDRNDMYLEHMRHFVRLVEDGISPSVSLNDAVLVLDLIETVRVKSMNG